MSSRELMHQALSPGGSPQVPVVVPYEGLFIRDHWAQLTACPWWWYWESDPEKVRTWWRQALETLALDWFSLPIGPAWRDLERYCILHAGQRILRQDQETGDCCELHLPVPGGEAETWGTATRSQPELPTSGTEVDALVGVPDASAPVPAPDPESLTAWLMAEFGDRMYPYCQVSGPLWACYGLWGYEGLMFMMATRPELVERACQRMLAGIEFSVKTMATNGAAGIWIEDCLMDQISPAMYHRFAVPYLRQLVNAIHAQGVHAIYYYAGNPCDRWELFPEISMDAISLEEGKKDFAIDIDEVAERLGRHCAVFGNLDAIGELRDATPGGLRQAITRQLRAGRRCGQRFVMSLGSPVTPETPMERFQYYLTTVRELALETI